MTTLAPWWNKDLEALYEQSLHAEGDELAEVEARVEAELCRVSTLHMGVKLWGGDPFTFEGSPMWVPYRHLRVLCEKLDLLERRKLGRSNLMVTMPPQHGKSSTVSVNFVVRYLTRRPDDRVLLTSYEAGKADRWGRDVRNFIGANTDFLGIEVSDDSRAINRWQIKGHRGGMLTAGVGGPLTGEPGDLIIIDDPVKNAKDAKSQIIQEDQWDWYTHVVQTRRQRETVKVLIQTRWNEADLAGRILEAEPHEWEVLNFPALAEEDDPLGREVGEPLCPELHPLADLESQRDLMTASAWSAVYQQRPAPAEGKKFKSSTFRYWTRESADRDFYRLHHDPTDTSLIPVTDCFRFATVDIAATVKRSSDWTVVSIWDVTPTEPTNLILVHRYRVRVETHLPLLKEAMKAYTPTWVGIEKATYGLAVVREARAAGIPTKKLKAETDKVSRSEAAQVLCENHRAFFPLQAPWLSEWEHELLVFDNGRHDDQVDTFSYAALEMNRLGHIAPKKTDPRTSPMRARLARRKRDSRLHPDLGRI